MAEFVDVSKKWNEVCDAMKDCDVCPIREACSSRDYAEVERDIVMAWDNMHKDCVGKNTKKLIDEIEELKNTVHNLRLYLSVAFAAHPELQEMLEDFYEGMPGYVKLKNV